MANTPISTLTNSLKVYNPDAIYVTPFVEGDVRGTKTYKLGEVIKDSTSIAQDDPTENKIENEFSSAPIINNVTLGSYQFSCEVADMQKDLLIDLGGFIAGQSNTDRVHAPAKYTPKYAEVALVFKVSDTKYVAAVLPKLQLNTKTTFDSLSSNMGRITLAGTGLNIAVADGAEAPIETPFYIDTNWTTAEL